MKVCLGGTFSPLHAGHRRLLSAALEAGNELFVGVTSDAFAAQSRDRRIAPLSERKRAVEDYVASTGWNGRLVVREITDRYCSTTEPGYEAIVVSEETRHVAGEVNSERARRDLPPLSVITVPYVAGEDLLPIKATRVAQGDIDPEGRRLRPVRIVAGTTNPAKIEGIRQAFEMILPDVSLRIEGVAADPGVPEQPWGAEAAEGARRRARTALQKKVDDHPAEYGIGVEAGLLEVPGIPKPLDVQFCCIRDPNGTETEGTGPGFIHPPAVLEAVRRGQTVGQALDALAEKKDVGRGEGTIGWLTKGRYTRSRLTAQAVMAALVPRVRHDTYAHEAMPHGKQ